MEYFKIFNDAISKNDFYTKNVKIDDSVDYVYGNEVIYNNLNNLLKNDNFILLNYIQNTSTAYINTTYTPNINTKIEIQFMQTTLGYTYPTLFGARNGASGTPRLYQHINPNKTNNGQCACLTSSIQTNITNCYTNTVHTLIQCKDYVELDGNKTTLSGITTINPGTALWLFNLHDAKATTSNCNFQGNMYYCKISENGVIKQYWLPAKRKSDNMIGMYDIVRNTFYVSVNSTTFSGG